MATLAHLVPLLPVARWRSVRGCGRCQGQWMLLRESGEVLRGLSKPLFKRASEENRVEPGQRPRYDDSLDKLTPRCCRGDDVRECHARERHARHLSVTAVGDHLGILKREISSALRVILAACACSEWPIYLDPPDKWVPGRRRVGRSIIRPDLYRWCCRRLCIFKFPHVSHPFRSCGDIGCDHHISPRGGHMAAQVWLLSRVAFCRARVRYNTRDLSVGTHF